jgi:hypothetical protein
LIENDRTLPISEAYRMNIQRTLLPSVLLLFACVSGVSAQDPSTPNTAGAPPKMLLLVHQEIQFGRAAERRKLEIASARAYDRLKVPLSWIELESLTGPPQALFFDPFDSFQDLDSDFVVFGQLFASHPEVAHLQEQIEAVVAAQTTEIAFRRDDLGYRVQSIDLSKARFFRVLDVRVHPGFESEFVEDFKLLAEAYEKINADTPWVVYQVNVGSPSLGFLVFVPMNSLKQNDDMLNWRKSIRDAEGEDVATHREQIAREAYERMESNLYVISPEMSHVSSDFAEGDPEFWSPKASAAPKPTTPPRTDSGKDTGGTKPSP